MNVLAINGSPRPQGKISILINEFVKELQNDNNSCTIINLYSLKNLADCKGCMACQDKGACAIRDDIDMIEKAITESDLIIFASPTHWGNISAKMLVMFERLYGFFIQEKVVGFPVVRNGKGKKAVLITSCSTKWPYDRIFKQSLGCFARIKEVCKYSGIKTIATFVLPGTLAMDQIPEKYLVKLKSIGKKVNNSLCKEKQ